MTWGLIYTTCPRVEWDSPFPSIGPVTHDHTHTPLLVLDWWLLARKKKPRFEPGQKKKNLEQMIHGFHKSEDYGLTGCKEEASDTPLNTCILPTYRASITATIFASLFLKEVGLRLRPRGPNCFPSSPPFKCSAYFCLADLFPPRMRSAYTRGLTRSTPNSPFYLSMESNTIKKA